MSDTVKFVLGCVLFVALLLANLALSPDDYIPVGEEPIPIEAELNGGKQIVQATLAWQHQGFRLYGFWFFPTSRELVLYNAEHGIRWGLKDEYRAQREDELAASHPVAAWRFFLAPVSIGVAIALVLLFLLLDRTIVDVRSWGKARAGGSFRSFKDYLVEDRKPKLFAGSAKSSMMDKVGAYRQFYACLSAGSPGESRDALLRILEHIARTGDLSVGVSFAFDNKLRERKDILGDEVRTLRTILGAPAGQVADEARVAAAQAKARFEAELGYNLIAVRPSFADKHNIRRQKLLTNLLDRVFSRIFPERILVLTYDDRGPQAQLKVRYAVSNTASLFTSSSESSVPMEQRKAYTGIRFDWDIVLSLQGKELLRRRFGSEPASSFRTSGSDAADVYKAMAMSAFVDMGKSLLTHFGVQAPEGAVAGGGEPKKIQARLFEQFSDEVVDAAVGLGAVDAAAATAFFQAHQADISSLMSGLAGDLDRMMDLYVNGLGQSVDLGDLAFEVIAGLLGDS
jgi:hypothetical protein